ncbi:MAG: M3 family oligoendopeptidase [Hyphomicrobiales bacterium]
MIVPRSSPTSEEASNVRARDAAPASAKAGFGALPEWNLADLYPAMDAPELRRDLAHAEEECKAFAAAYRGKLADLLAGKKASAALHAAIARYEKLDEVMNRVMSYVGLVYAGDTGDPIRAKLYGDTQERLTAAGSDILFFQLELNQLDDKALMKAGAKAPLSRYRPWLEDIRREKPYQLEDKLERLFLEKSVSGASAWNRLFDETMAALRFDVEGEELTLEPTLNKLQSTDAKVRKRAAEALAKVFKENLRVFTLITNTLAKDKDISDRWRGFKDVADARHLSNRVEPEVVEGLVASVRAAYPRLSHRYYKLKARWFGEAALEFWDRNAPLPKVESRIIRWDEAKHMVLSAYGDFAPQMAKIAERFFDERWIDAPVRPGKAPGAFSHPTVPSAHPYVLLNYQGKPRDVMTLAHELGHGVHQVLSAPNGALMANAPLTLAETASVFAEMLTFRKLLGETRSVAQRKVMLAQKVEDMINTVVRQIAFYSFEREVHNRRKAGELTADQLCATWMRVQGESLGPAIRLGSGYETFWTYVSHFIHAPFYVYAYAFGDCLVNSLFAIYEKAHAGFAEAYFDMLKAGGTKHHGELLAPFGLDARDPSFWEAGLSLIERMIVELEAME